MRHAGLESHRRHPLPWIATLGGTVALVGIAAFAADRIGILPTGGLPARDQSQAAGQPHTPIETAQEYTSRLMESPKLREWRNSLPDSTSVSARTYPQPVSWQVPIPEHVTEEIRGV